MHLFKDYTFTWWQVGLLKTYVAAGALLLGSYFPEFIVQYRSVLIILFVLLLGYFLYVMAMKKL